MSNNTTNLRITMAQLNPIVGDIEGNARRMLDEWLLWDDRSDLILFPEMCLCGYSPEDLVLNSAFMHTIKRQIDQICEESKQIRSAALISTPWTDGARVFNSVLLIERGKIIAVQHKVRLPNYTVFDEPRTFHPANKLPDPISFRGVKLGLMICEDMWFQDVPLHLAKNGAQILICVNASPYDYAKHPLRVEVAKRVTSGTKLSLVYLNLCGGQDELVFDGRSFIMHSNGQVVHESAQFAEESVNFIAEFSATSPKLPLFNVLEGKDHKTSPTFVYTEIYEALKTGLRDYVHKNGFENVLIGLSGGIDSAFVAAIAVDALGAQHVRCVMLPSEFTSQDSLDDAQGCAQRLGVHYEIIPIKDAVKTFEALIPSLSGVAHENTQSRIRGTILMALSNISHEMLLTTGNKSEMATGYATLYGDMNGGYNPLKDLYKTDIYQLCAWRNHVKEVIPPRILTKAPSAELRPNQTDQDSLPPYEILDDILRCLIEYDNANWNQAQEMHLARRATALKHPKDLEKVAKLLRNSEFKRFQSSPGTRVSPRAFGKDRRYPLTNRFLNNVEKD